MTEEPKSRSRIGLVLIGVIVGCVATIAVVKWSSSSSGDERPVVGASPSAASMSEPASEPTSPSVTRGQAIVVTGTPVAQQAPIFDTDPNVRPTDQSDSPPAAPAETTKDGVIVLPQEASDHRVFVDGRVVPVKNSRAVVPCGTREVRIGSHGAPSNT